HRPPPGRTRPRRKAFLHRPLATLNRSPTAEIIASESSCVLHPLSLSSGDRASATSREESSSRKGFSTSPLGHSQPISDSRNNCIGIILRPAPPVSQLGRSCIGHLPGGVVLAERLFYIAPWPLSTDLRQPK